MTLDKIIKGLGGNAAVAAWCGVAVAAVSNWKTRGLPPGRQLDLFRMAKAKRNPLTLEQLAAADALIRGKAAGGSSRRRSSAECTA